MQAEKLCVFEEEGRKQIGRVIFLRRQKSNLIPTVPYT